MKITLEPGGASPPSALVAANIRSMLQAARVVVASSQPTLQAGSSITAWYNTTTGQLQLFTGQTPIAYTPAHSIVSATPPEDPMDGTQWFDTDVERLYSWYDGSWVTVGDGGFPEAPLMVNTKHGRMDAAWHPIVSYLSAPPVNETLRTVVISGLLGYDGTPIISTPTAIVEISEESSIYAGEGFTLAYDSGWELTHTSGARWTAPDGALSLAMWTPQGDSTGGVSATYDDPSTVKTTGNIVIETGEHPPYLWLNHGTDADPSWRRGDRLEGDNGAYIRPGQVTGLNPYGLGYEIVCSASYVDLFMVGEHYALDQDGFTVRAVYHCFTEWNPQMDSIRGYSVGVRRTYQDGQIWECVDAAPNNAVWIRRDIPYDLGTFSGSLVLSRLNGAEQRGEADNNVTLYAPLHGEEGQSFTLSFYTSTGGPDIELNFSGVQMSDAESAALPITLVDNRSYIIELGRVGYYWALKAIHGPTLVD